MPHILVLGGTSEASALAGLLAVRGIRATLSYAGRTANPGGQPLPVRVGGFGGTEGLLRHIAECGVTHLVDATHPFAATMSANAARAAGIAGIPIAALTRPAWRPGAGDRWTHVADIGAAAAALDGPPRRVMLALGRMHVEAFVAQPQHHYLLRFVDAPDAAPALPRHSLVIARGPFNADSDAALMALHGIEIIVCKNAGGGGAEAKLIAARRLELPVIIIDRPELPRRTEFHDAKAVVRWLGHDADRGV